MFEMGSGWISETISSHLEDFMSSDFNIFNFGEFRTITYVNVVYSNWRIAYGIQLSRAYEWAQLLVNRKLNLNWNKINFQFGFLGIFNIFGFFSAFRVSIGEFFAT